MKTKILKWAMKCFGILDGLQSILVCQMAVVWFYILFSDSSVGMMVHAVQILLAGFHFLLCISLVFTAYGFFAMKKWVWRLYYIQFPFKIAFCGTLLIYVAVDLGSEKWNWAPFVLVVLCETIRLAITIMACRHFMTTVSRETH